ncbi:S-formylglutathione hydrolase FrmB [Maribacter vaceletii]|uniref:S-formylglutathione hydrolase FrmB n=1 Tax=Maribacter vaceletii TaxID=1206816 RepID=A0A495EBR9_9FLAO|nr:alpha/beta hydrolase-fold protein [Maribacter vaceletii]RKR14325.1 S-formylglutathione hydrolase FrmB [Maribacter vaceletii]
MFRTTEISDPEFESNNLRFITVKTKNLKGRGDICLFVPPVKNAKDLPIVLLLHGVYGSAWIWSQKTGVHITAWEMMQKGTLKPMIIAMPSDGLWGDGSAYLPHNQRNFEKWIVEDVPNAILENIDATSKNSNLYIGGLSMGGFGALNLGIKHAPKFKAVSGHSSITSFEQMSLFVEEPLHEYDALKKEIPSVFKTIIESKNKLPKFRFDCGKEDILIEHNRKLHQQLEEENIAHIYEEFPGKHEWPYWTEHVIDTLQFFNSEEKPK